jgi:AhpD family alkylhydroperoxidase
MSEVDSPSRVPDLHGHFRDLMPETAKLFDDFGEQTFQDGALSFKIKELIALGIAINARCEACINYHIDRLKACGATKGEILEAMCVGLEMGPGLIITPLRNALYRHFPP